MKTVSKELQEAKDEYTSYPGTLNEAMLWKVSLKGYTPETQEAILLDGAEAEAEEMESLGQELYGIAGGIHHGHTVSVSTAKYNCGAYSEIQKCSCGAKYMNAMNGCWQQSHKREEDGTPIV